MLHQRHQPPQSTLLSHFVYRRNIQRIGFFKYTNQAFNFIFDIDTLLKIRSQNKQRVLPKHCSHLIKMFYVKSTLFFLCSIFIAHEYFLLNHTCLFKCNITFAAHLFMDIALMVKDYTFFHFDKTGSFHFHKNLKIICNIYSSVFFGSIQQSKLCVCMCFYFYLRHHLYVCMYKVGLP